MKAEYIPVEGDWEAAVARGNAMKNPAVTKKQWATRLNWLEGVIVERGLPEHATLVAQNLHAAWVADDFERVELLWNTFLANNPAFC